MSSGTTVTLTALVDTTQKNIPVTGTFTFYSTNGVLNATPTIKQVTDSSGYSALQATLTVTINSTIDFSFHYSGDSNYVEGQSNDIQIGVPDFYMSPTFGYVTMSAGQSQQLAVNISDLYGFNGAVTNFACSGLPADTTCSFSPDSVTGSGSTTMTITTTALGQSRARTLRASNRPWWPTWVMAAFGICLVGVSRRGRHNSALALVLCLSLLAFLGCGGSSSYGGGGGGGTSNPKPSISSLAPGSLAAGSNAQSLTINGSGFISSSAVAFNGLSHQPSYMSANQLSVWLTAADLSGTGTFPVTVTNSAPGGGTSAAVNFNVVTGTPSGTFPVSVTATGAGFTHTFTFTLVIQ